MANAKLTFEVRGALDVFRARSGVRKLASELRFAPRVCEELAIVASELSSNIVKYGVRGSIEAEPALRESITVGIVVTARDVGPRFRSFETALKDGHDDRGPIDPSTLLKRGGLGSGLGAVVRMSDSLHLEYDDGGKRIVVVRYLGVRPRQASFV